MRVRPIRNMVNHETNELFFDNFEIPADESDWRRRQGLSVYPRRHERRANSHRRGMHRRRLLVHRPRADVCDATASCSTGRSGRTRAFSFRSRARTPTSARPISCDTRRRACSTTGAPCGAEANMAKLLAADASWEAANVCLQTFGGFGFAAEYDVERKFRETRLYQVAPISTNMILSYIGEHVLGCRGRF